MYRLESFIQMNIPEDFREQWVPRKYLEDLAGVTPFPLFVVTRSDSLWIFTSMAIEKIGSLGAEEVDFQLRGCIKSWSTKDMDRVPALRIHLAKFECREGIRSIWGLRGLMDTEDVKRLSGRHCVWLELL